jgi:hypothetical protein
LTKRERKKVRVNEEERKGRHGVSALILVRGTKQEVERRATRMLHAAASSRGRKKTK